jgi:hypothetical protein
MNDAIRSARAAASYSSAMRASLSVTVKGHL